MNTKNILGFNLIEALVAISILAIVLTIAIPSFISMMRNNAIISASNDLISSLQLARSEALKRNVPVSVCATNDDSFSACSNQWNVGWIVFVNPTGGTTLNNTLSAPLLRTQTVQDANISITVAPNVNIITYQGSGFTAAGSSNVNFTITASGCTIDSGRNIGLSATGRPQVTHVNCP